MYKKLSFKIRIIILSIFCLIGISILIYTFIDNRKSNNYIATTKANKNEKITSVNAKNKKSVNKAKEAQNEKQKQIDALTEKGYQDFGAKNYTVAINEENQALQLDKNNARAHAVKGIALCYSKLDTESFNQGLAEIDISLKINPNYGYARFNRALSLERYGKYDDALIWYDKALQVDNFVWSYYGKACIYGRKGDVDNSVKYLKIAISMQANIKDEARSEEDFQNVRNSEAFKQVTSD